MVAGGLERSFPIGWQAPELPANGVSVSERNAAGLEPELCIFLHLFDRCSSVCCRHGSKEVVVRVTAGRWILFVTFQSQSDISFGNSVTIASCHPFFYFF